MNIGQLKGGRFYLFSNAFRQRFFELKKFNLRCGNS